MGKEVFSRLQGRIFPHDPHASDNVIIGKTHRGTVVEINRYVAFADLIIGVGECMPHPIAPDSEADVRSLCPASVLIVLWPIIILPGCATETVG